MSNLNKLRAFLIYNKNGRLVTGPILRTQVPKNGQLFIEIPVKLCCDDIPVPTFIESPSKLKGYVRYTEAGRVIPNSLIKRTKKPSIGNWVAFPIDRCCFYVTTTTTTTTSSSTTTTTTTTP